MQINEEWLPIEEYEGYYEASSFGKIRSLDRVQTYSNGRTRQLKGRILSPGISNGYYSLVLCKEGVKQTIQVHVIICDTFHGNTNNLPTVNHKDGNKLNNYKDNLERATWSEQHLHAHRIGIKGMNSRALNINNVKEIKELLLTNRTKQSIADEFGVSIRTIFNIQNETTWKKA